MNPCAYCGLPARGYACRAHADLLAADRGAALVAARDSFTAAALDDEPPFAPLKRRQSGLDWRRDPRYRDRRYGG